MDILAADLAAIHHGENQFEFLRDDALNLHELGLVIEGEFFEAGEAEVMVELLPAFEIALHAANNVLQSFRTHNFSSLEGSAVTGKQSRRHAGCARSLSSLGNKR